MAGLNNTMAIVDVVDYEVQEYKTRDLLFSVDYATSVGITYEAESLEIRGGINAPVRIAMHHSPTSEFTSELPLIDINALGTKVGRRVEKENITAPMSEVLYVDSSSKVDLTYEPLDGTLKVYVLEANGRDKKVELIAGASASATEYEVTDTKITVDATILEGAVIKVLYDYTAGEGASRVRITSKDFPNFIRITGRGYALDEDGGKAPIAFIIHKAKPTPEFEMNFESGEATSTPFNAMIFPEKIGCTEVFSDIIPLGNEEFITCED